MSDFCFDSPPTKKRQKTEHMPKSWLQPNPQPEPGSPERPQLSPKRNLSPFTIEVSQRQTKSPNLPQSQPLEWITTHARDGFRIQTNGGKGTKVSDAWKQPTTPTKKAKRPVTAKLRKHKQNYVFGFDAVNNCLTQTVLTTKSKFFEEYEVRQKLGDGEFGSVQKCLHTATKEVVAVKVAKQPYEGERDRKQKLEEVYKLFKLCSIKPQSRSSNLFQMADSNQEEVECPVVMIKEAWE